MHLCLNPLEISLSLVKHGYFNQLRVNQKKKKKKESGLHWWQRALERVGLSGADNSVALFSVCSPSLFASHTPHLARWCCKLCLSLLLQTPSLRSSPGRRTVIPGRLSSPRWPAAWSTTPWKKTPTSCSHAASWTSDTASASCRLLTPPPPPPPLKHFPSGGTGSTLHCSREPLLGGEPLPGSWPALDK